MEEYESLVIEVTGINSNTSEDTLENYFSSARRGGDVTNVDYNKGSGKALITFANAQDARKALDTSPHVLEGSTLTTREKRVEIYENDKVFVEGISTTTTKDCLQLYIERISGLEVKNVTYGKKTSDSVNAIVSFTSTIDFEKIQEGFKKKPTLEDRNISIKTVPLCKIILVKNLPTSATYDSVMFRFENRKRAGGGTVARVDLDLEKRIALVEFEDPNVIDSVLSVEQTLDQCILSVERYHPLLGSLADFQSTKQETEPLTASQVLKPQPKPRQRKISSFTEGIDRDLYDYLEVNHPAQLSYAIKDPQPNIQLTDETAHFVFSTQDAKTHFLDSLKDYRCEIVPINLSLLEHGLTDEIQDIIPAFGSSKSVMFIERYSEGYIKLVGRAIQSFEIALEEVRKCIARTEKRSSQREDIIEILPVHLKLLRRVQRFQRLENSFKRDGCQIQLDDTAGKMTVKGSAAQVRNLKKQTQDIVGRFDERRLNQSKFSLLRTLKGLSYVQTLFSTAGDLTVEISVIDQDIMMYAVDSTQVQRAYKTIEDNIDELTLPQSLQTKTSQDALLKELGTSIPFTSDTTQAKPRIVCFKKDLRNLRGKIEDFCERNKTVDTRVPLGQVILRYLKLHGETMLEGLSLSTPGLNIVQSSDALIVSGEKPLVENCCTSIQQFVAGLKYKRMDYGTPETASGIKAAATMAIIHNIERKHRCAIAVTTNEITDTRCSMKRPPTQNTRVSNENLKRTMQCRYKYPSGKTIEVHQGDIINFPVYYLVNSANDEMKHGGGLAGAIVEKGGQKIQEESFRAMQGRGKLLVGDVVTTHGGNLLCKEILHVVVPKFTRASSGDDCEKTELYLRHCCTKVLEKATNGTTIAIPALGTGIFMVPKDISAKSLVEATHNFFQENPSHPLKEVHFVDNEPSAIEALMKEMMSKFQNDMNFEINDLVRDRWRPYLGAVIVTPPTPAVVPSGDIAFTTPEGMEIRLVVGNIAKSTTQVIVNTVSGDLNLTKNPCSKAILTEAGNKITDLCSKWIKDKGQVQEGDFAITNGAKLRCNQVFHVSCPKWTQDNGEKKLRDLVQKILNKVQNLQLASISIPALGTGSLNFPEELVAKVLIEEAKKFSSKHKSSLKIKQYNVVVYSGNAKAVGIFKQQFQVFSNAKVDKNIHKTPEKRIGFRKSSSKKNKNPEDETYGVNVEIVHGNIVHESTDAIGFLVSENITEGGQIGKALLQEAGVSLTQEYSRLGKIEAGTVVMTTAGNLKTTCLLHMVVKLPSFKSEKSMIENAVRECLKHADLCGFESLSLPAVGTGHLKKDAKQSSEILHECIKEYRKREDKSLKLIRIVILEKKVFTDFNKAFTRKDPSFGDSKGPRKRQEITLEIVAETHRDITKIEEELRQVEAEQRHSENIEVGQKLDEATVNEIMEVQDLHDVFVECTPEIGLIRVSGLAKNVLNAVGEIHRIIREWETEKHDTDATVREVKWFYYVETEDIVLPQKYSDRICAEIERAHQKDNSGSVVLGEDMQYEIDFKTMTEKCLSSNDTAKVYRRLCEAIPLPSSWEYQPIECATGTELQVHSAIVEYGCAEFNSVHDMFKSSIALAPRPLNTEVVKIERIQNPRLYQIYEGHKRKMKNGGNEMRLFHGTSLNTVESINTNGFNRSYCGKNAVRFGNGAYFAKTAWYSARNIYSVPDANGYQYMYIARVLVGDFTKGKQGLIVPPPLHADNLTVSYDSVVDDVTKPQIFVIFYDYQSYPEYLVTFKSS